MGAILSLRGTRTSTYRLHHNHATIHSFQNKQASIPTRKDLPTVAPRTYFSHQETKLGHYDETTCSYHENQVCHLRQVKIKESLLAINPSKAVHIKDFLMKDKTAVSKFDCTRMFAVLDMH